MTKPTPEVGPLSGPTGRLVAAHRDQLREVLENGKVRGKVALTMCQG